jgi:hypothetical protein
MHGDIISEIPHSFSNPRRFLMEDECIEDYRERLVGLVMDLKPRGALEFRQVELICSLTSTLTDSIASSGSGST